MTICDTCEGSGVIPNGSCCGEACGGWADTCEDCNGSGKRYFCMVEGCQQKPAHLKGDVPLCCTHYDACDCTDDDYEDAVIASQDGSFSAIH